MFGNTPTLLLALVLAGASLPAQTPALTTQRVASGLTRPVLATAPAGDLERLFLVEQGGLVKILRGGRILAQPFIDLSGLATRLRNEQGLLGLAFHPEYGKNGLFYVNYTRKPDGATVVAEYKVSKDPDLADPGSARILITVSQPFSNHNGGMIEFGPRDGFLYIALGDGGSANDPGNRSQNLGTLLGKLLRIDVDRQDPNLAYAIPANNPFRKTANARPEIWASGLRNPWRFAFDPANGDLYIGDVGQGAREEIDYQPASSMGGENYGWRCMEGFLCTNLSGCTCNAPGLTLPVHDYGRNQGCSVTGGRVYRGCAIPGLEGTYFFADYCSSRIWTFRMAGGKVTRFKERTSELDPGGGLKIQSISSFGQDGHGELYLTDLFGGQVFKILRKVPGPALTLGGTARPGGTTSIQAESSSDGGRTFVCPFSLSTEPALALPGAPAIHLRVDNLFLLSLEGTTIFQGNLGTLDGQGKASLKLNLPNLPELSGLNLYTALVVVDPQAPFGLKDTSCPLLIKIQ